MRFTCNKKAFPQFAKDCKQCPEYDPCARGGKWCFVVAMGNERLTHHATLPLTQDIAMPVLVKHDYRDIKIAENTTVTIDIEELKEKMRQDLMPNLMECGG